MFSVKPNPRASINITFYFTLFYILVLLVGSEFVRLFGTDRYYWTMPAPIPGYLQSSNFPWSAKILASEIYESYWWSWDFLMMKSIPLMCTLDIIMTLANATLYKERAIYFFSMIFSIVFLLYFFGVSVLFTILAASCQQFYLCRSVDLTNDTLMNPAFLIVWLGALGLFVWSAIGMCVTVRLRTTGQYAYQNKL